VLLLSLVILRLQLFEGALLLVQSSQD
jgi:hypothetical protein